MSGFCAGAYAKVWEVKPTDSKKRTTLRVSINEKTKDGEWNQTFSGFVQMLGKEVAEKARSLDKGDVIQFKIVDVTNMYDKKRDATLVTYKCFAFNTREEAEEERSMKDVQRSTQRKDEVFIPLDSEEDLPF